MRTLSFRARLTVRWTAAFGCVLALLCLGVYAGTRAFLYAELDAQLRTLAGTELASATDGATGVHFHEFPAEEVSGTFAGKFAQLYDRSGRLLSQSAVLGNAPALVGPDRQQEAFAGRAPVFSVDAAGRPARVIALTTRKDGEPYIVAVGLFTEPIVTTLHRVAWLLAGLSLAGLVLTGLVGYLLATRALQPVAHVTERAARIARGDFSARLDHPEVDDELGRMTRLLNEMLERLHGSVQANRRFAADASHELRSPLTAMLGEIDVTLKRPRLADEYRESLLIVRDRIRQLAEMTEQLMILVRAQEGQVVGATEVDLESLAHDVVGAVAPVAAERHVTVDVRSMHGAVIYADRGLFTRVLDNLVRNAVQYNRPGGAVTISADVEDAGTGDWTSAHTVLRVSDTGQGIPDADRDRVFERFYRVERSRNRRMGGAGLGLAIASEVVRLFSGTIRVASSSPEGTTIEVRLPGARVATTAAPQTAQPALNVTAPCS
ncbi:MAG: HAMP domain-containing protein [Acidobacteria bacterium]|nr:HAMP domain-containing protein [Acidobacteriota bacterium]